MDFALSLMVLTAIALVAGAAFLWRRNGFRLQVALMLVLAAIIAGNVAIWVIPTRDGPSPLTATTPDRAR